MRSNKHLIISKLDEKLLRYGDARAVIRPQDGWIAAIRSSLNMTMEQLGRRLSISRQGVQKLEKREAEGAVTVNALRDAANALDMQLVYAIIPKTGTLEEYLEEQARRFAAKIVHKANQQMRLEAQGVDQEKIEQAIQEATEELVRKVDRQLWDSM